MSAVRMISVLSNLFLQICTVPGLTPVITIISFTGNTITHMNTNATDRSGVQKSVHIMVNVSIHFREHLHQYSHCADE